MSPLILDENSDSQLYKTRLRYVQRPVHFRVLLLCFRLLPHSSLINAKWHVLQKILYLTQSVLNPAKPVASADNSESRILLEKKNNLTNINQSPDS